MDGRTLEKRYDEVRGEVQYLRLRCRDLEQELRVCGPELHRAHQRIDRLEQSDVKYRDENKRLKQRLADLTAMKQGT
jgi:chromosome segregation ATPase